MFVWAARLVTSTEEMRLFLRGADPGDQSPGGISVIVQAFELKDKQQIKLDFDGIAIRRAKANGSHIDGVVGMLNVHTAVNVSGFGIYWKAERLPGQFPNVGSWQAHATQENRRFDHFLIDGEGSQRNFNGQTIRLGDETAPKRL
jgi:hypothetical protein